MSEFVGEVGGPTTTVRRGNQVTIFPTPEMGPFVLPGYSAYLSVTHMGAPVMPSGVTFSLVTRSAVSGLGGTVQVVPMSTVATTTVVKVEGGSNLSVDTQSDVTLSWKGFVSEEPGAWRCLRCNASNSPGAQQCWQCTLIWSV